MANIKLGIFLVALLLGIALGVSSWARANTYNGSTAPSWSHGKIVAVDSLNNYWVAGNFNSGKLKFGTTTLTASNADVYVTKFSSTGAVVVALEFVCVGATDLADVTGVVVDSGNNV